MDGWFEKISAFFVMVAAVLLSWQASKHFRRQEQFERRAEKLEEKKGASVKSAERARAHAQFENSKANETLKEAERRSQFLKEKGHESLADRIDSFNDRMRDGTPT